METKLFKPASKTLPSPHNNQITILTSRKFLGDLSSSLNKIIISAEDYHYHSAFLNAVNSSIAIYQFIYDESNLIGVILPLGETLNDDSVEIQWPPTFCLGFLVFSAQGKEQLEPLVNWWQTKGREENTPNIFKLDYQDKTPLETQFWQLIASTLMTESKEIAQRLTTLHRQYLSLRTLHENVQNAFAAVEDFLSQAKLPNLQLKFENQPTKNYVIPTPGSDFVLKQLLPIGSRGLAAVDFHVNKNNINSRGMMVVAVDIPEDKTCLAKWQVPYQHLKAGWFSLDLPSIDIGFQREIELSIEFQTKVGPAPCLSLGMIQPVPEYQAYTKQESFPQSLAFRLWTGLPGSRRVISPYSASIVGDENELSESIKSGYLGQRALLSLQEVTPNLETDACSYVHIIEEGAKIQIHPRPIGLTVAMLPYCFPPSASHLTATVATEHANASIVEYAMAVIQEGMEPQACFENENNQSTLGFSGWVAVEANTPSQLQLSVEVSRKEHYHIAIATRLPPNTTMKFAWARWLNFHIT